MQTVGDLAQRQGAHPRGGQLNRQRHPIQALADLGQQLDIFADTKLGAHKAGPIDKLLDGLLGQR